MINIGTISHGTLRPQDLLRSFSEAYKQYCADEPDYDDSLVRRAGYFAEFLDVTSDHPRNNETAQMVIDQLIDGLNEVAVRHNCYFGAHEGDGSDFGFWPEPEHPEGWEYVETGTDED